MLKVGDNVDGWVVVQVAPNVGFRAQYGAGLLQWVDDPVLTAEAPAVTAAPLAPPRTAAVKPPRRGR